MKKRSTRKPTAEDFLASPPSTASPDRWLTDSPEKKKQFEFDLNTAFNNAASSSKKRKKKKADVASSSMDRIQNVAGSPLNVVKKKSMSTIPELRDMAASRLDFIKHQLDRSDAEILKDFQASHSRLCKRYKIQTQICQQVVDEAEKEYKKFSDLISESREAMKASYSELLAEVQASVSHVCKTTIPELKQTVEKSLDVLRSRYGISNAM